MTFFPLSLIRISKPGSLELLTRPSSCLLRLSVNLVTRLDTKVELAEAIVPACSGDSDGAGADSSHTGVAVDISLNGESKTTSS